MVSERQRSPQAPQLLARYLNKNLDPHNSTPHQDAPQTLEEPRGSDKEAVPNTQEDEEEEEEEEEAEEEEEELDEEVKQEEDASFPLQTARKPQSKAQRAVAQQKLRLLAENFNPVPFPSKTLDFSAHEDLFRALNLWDFVNLDLSFDVRSDLLILLIANYEPSKQVSFVNNVEISVSRLDIAIALKLPLEKETAETHQDILLKDEMKEVILEFLSSYVLLVDEDEMCILAEEAVAAAKLVKEGKANEVDWAGLLWDLVEKEILDAPRSGICRYALHLLCLIKCQQPILFEKDAGLEMVISIPEPMDDGSNNKEVDGEYLEEFRGLGLSVGRDENGDLMDGVEDCKGERNWVDGGKDEDEGFEHCMRRCNSREVRVMEFEDLCKGDAFSNLDRLTSTDLLHAVEGVQVSCTPRMDSLDHSNGDFLSAGVDGNKNASCSLFFENNGKRHIDNVDIDVDDSGHFHPDNHLKRMRCGGLWEEQAPSGFDSYVEQIQCTMGKAKAIYAKKEQACLDAGIQLQFLNEMIKQKDQVIRTLEKTQVEENQTWQHNVHRYEQELNILANLVVGYKKALKDTQKKFEEYRKKCPEGEVPFYQDVGGAGGLVLASRELERLQLEKEEEMRQTAEEMVDAFQCVWLTKFEEYTEMVVMLQGKVVELHGEVKLIKERFAKRKGTET